MDPTVEIALGFAEDLDTVFKRPDHFLHVPSAAELIDFVGELLYVVLQELDMFLPVSDIFSHFFVLSKNPVPLIYIYVIHEYKRTGISILIISAEPTLSRSPKPAK